MRKKSQNIISRINTKGKYDFSKWLPVLAILTLLLLWQLVCAAGLVPKYMLPSPIDVGKAFTGDFSYLMFNARVTLTEAFIGLLVGIAVGFFAAVIMDRFHPVYKAFYPMIVLTQTIPTVAIAPLLVLWFGYEMTPKIILIVLATFFPIAVSMLDGFRQADPDMIHLMRSMGASTVQIFRHVKFPGALPHFFASLRISVSYAIVTAVIAEWLGGFNGLGVYMTRVKKSFAFDKMFAVIFLISFLSLLLMKLVDLLQKKCMPWNQWNSDQHSRTS